jgi:hypothetical protein
MTLEQYAAIAEIIGVILVIGSLVYVARQLGQNTKMMRATAAGQRVQRDAELNFRVSDNNDGFTEIWLKGITALDSLSEAERIRLIFFNRSAIVHWHNMFSLRSQNLLPDSAWNEMTWLIRHVGLRQDLLEAWRMFKGSFDIPFQKFLDSELAAAEPLS